MREEEESLAQEDLAEVRRLGRGGRERRGMTWGFKGFGRAAAPIFKSGRTAARVHGHARAGTSSCRSLETRWTGGLVQGCGGLGGADRPGSRRP